jgi:hypothetical protein
LDTRLITFLWEEGKSENQIMSGIISQECYGSKSAVAIDDGAQAC